MPHLLISRRIRPTGRCFFILSSALFLLNTATIQAQVPVVSITAPANGAIITGTVLVSANAYSNTGITGLQFQLDGANLGSSLTGSGPGYLLLWDTTTAAAGFHTLTVVASDAASNNSTASLSVTVSNQFTIGERVQTTTSAGVYDSFAGTLLGTQSAQSLCTITAGLCGLSPE